jgi:UDP-N-acetylglucosamine--N-acetylmuramyl-(pentapeptide) pyrophosphoryl-undecaprenol N-acetylglucosamine transferase
MTYSEQVFNSLFVLVAGGTGGHVMPALSVGRALKKRGHSVVYITDHRCTHYFSTEDDIVLMPFASLGEKSIKNIFSIIVKMLKGMKICRDFFQQHRPLRVIGFGGYSTFPPLAIAFLSKIPFLLYEPDSFLGIVNRLFAKRAEYLLTGFQKVQGIPKNVLHQWTGMPIRQEFMGKRQKNISSEEEIFKVFVVGGSQGAALFSKILPAAVGLLPLEMQKKIHITQQVRKELEEETRHAYEKTASTLIIQSFFPHIWEEMAKADLIISRAGASSIAEVMILGKACLFVPYKAAQNNHQMTNALALEEKKAAWVMEEPSFTSVALSQFLQQVLADQQGRQQRATQAGKMAKENATDTVAQIILENSINQ